MPDSVYKVIEVIGTSPTSFAEAAKAAVDKVAAHVKDLRVAEVVEFDMKIEDNKKYRVRILMPFKCKKCGVSGYYPNWPNITCSCGAGPADLQMAAFPGGDRAGVG